MNVRTVRADQVPLLASIKHGGAWRVVEGVSLNAGHAIVSVKLHGWGAAIDFPAGAHVTILRPERAP